LFDAGQHASEWRSAKFKAVRAIHEANKILARLNQPFGFSADTVMQREREHLIQRKTRLHDFGKVIHYRKRLPCPF
jgi:hypothetical protein